MPKRLGGAPKKRRILPRAAIGSGWLATLAALALAGWMLSGGGGEDEGGVAPRAAQMPSVRTRMVAAEPVPLALEVFGQSQPSQSTPLRPGAGGVVREVGARPGDRVAEGDVILRVSPGSRDEDLARALADLERSREALGRSEELVERGVAATRTLEDALAGVDAAEVALAVAQAEIAALTLHAPMAGLIADLTPTPGSLVAAEEEVGRIVRLDPLEVTIRIPQREVGALAVGATAELRFVTGVGAEATLTYVAPVADPQTRSFPARLTLPNPDGAIQAGLTAEVVLPLGKRSGHRIETSTLSLDPDGRVGVKTVEDGAVVFHEVEILRATEGALWVAGLPERAEMIVVGQGFTQAGDAVRAVRDAADADYAGPEG